jgi:hypothetical protein
MRGVHGVWSQLSPSATHVPHVGLQHTCPTLQVFCPHIVLTGAWMRGVHGVWSQLSPAVTHVPHVGLQHAWPVLQVFCPHIVLTG